MRFFVSISNICNINCPMCKSQDYPQKKEFMPFEVFQRVVSAIAEKFPHAYIYLHTTNEPILHPDIVNILNYIQEIGLACTISSNGQALDRFIEKMDSTNQKPRRLKFRFSIDGGKKKTYEIMRHKGNFEKLIDNYFAIQEYTAKNNIKYDCKVNYILTEDTAKELYSFLLKFGNPIFDVDKLDLSFLSAHSFTGINHFIREHSMYPLVNRIVHASCPTLTDTLTVFENGDVGCCCEHRGDDSFIIGNILNEDLDAIMKSKKRQGFIEAERNSDLKRLPAACSRCFISSREINQKTFHAQAGQLVNQLFLKNKNSEIGDKALYECVLNSIHDRTLQKAVGA